MAPPGSQRLWVGPLMLILVIALIYVFSLMPNAPPHRDYVPDMPGEIRIGKMDDMVYAPPSSPSCMNGGKYNETAETCDCVEGFRGARCQIVAKTNCLNHGIYSHRLGHCLCQSPFVGDHCEMRCSGGLANHITNSCDCLGRFFGTLCDMLCMHGDIVNGTCICRAGYDGASCTACDPPNGENCDHSMKRRGAVNSRLTLSGLSFCMITIGLLCLTARRRRAGLNASNDETWYRVFNPNTTRPGRCRHDFMCGGSWFPRDRALLVAPGRATVSHGNRRSQQSRSGSRRLATPPPSYTSVDNLTEEPMPPTYEEATRVLEDRRELIVDETAVIKEEETQEESPSVPAVPSPSTSSSSPPPAPESA